MLLIAMQPAWLLAGGPRSAAAPSAVGGCQCALLAPVASDDAKPDSDRTYQRDRGCCALAMLAAPPAKAVDADAEPNQCDWSCFGGACDCGCVDDEAPRGPPMPATPTRSIDYVAPTTAGSPVMSLDTLLQRTVVAPGVSQLVAEAARSPERCARLCRWRT